MDELADVSALAQVSERYQPAARFWAMRFAALYYGIDPAELIMDTLQIEGDGLVVPDNYYSGLSAHLVRRQQNLAQNQMERERLQSLPASRQKADIAEWYRGAPDSQLEPGDVVSIGTVSGLSGIITKPSQSSDSKLLGIVSTNPHTVLGKKTSADDVRIAVTGRVPVKIDPDSQPITAGDFLTSSDKPGLAMKATKAGYSVGKALESWTSGGPDRIEAFVNLGYYDPDLMLTSTGDLNIVGSENGSFSLKDKNDSLVTRAGAFADLATAKFKAGLIETRKLIVDGVDLVQKLNELSQKVDKQQEEIQDLKKEIEQLHRN